MKQIFTLTILFTTFIISAQTVASFENIDLTSESFLNGSDGSGGFSSGHIFLPNDYNDAWQSWTGWAISNTTDVTTPGPQNQYSAIAGGGAEGSSNFAVTFIVGSGIINLENEAASKPVDGFYITNNTYAYLSMLEGDGFAKKFGGVTGNDPDFFLLTIKKYLNGNLSTDSIDFYLADYRFEDNTQDYIVNTWEYIDLAPLGDVDSLVFTLSSSDTGQFGMNTPAYFCMDNFTTVDGLSSTTHTERMSPFEIYPNPATDFIKINTTDYSKINCYIFSVDGKLISNTEIFSNELIDIRHLKSGGYILKIKGIEGKQSLFFVKE